MSKHTPEPWSKEDFQRFPFTEITQRGLQIEDFARAVACVNACAGIDDPAKYMEGVKILEKAYHDLQAEKTILRKERDELLAALEALTKAIKFRTAIGQDIAHELIEAEKAIVKVKGGDS